MRKITAGFISLVGISIVVGLLVVLLQNRAPQTVAVLDSPLPTPTVREPEPTRKPTEAPKPTVTPRVTLTPPGLWRAENVRAITRGPLRLPPEAQARLTKPETRLHGPVFSPDGENVLLEFFSGEYFRLEEKGGVALLPKPELWLIENLDAPQVKVSTLAENATGASWSPDGQFIAYSHLKGPFEYELWLMRPDGSDKRFLAKNTHGLRTRWRDKNILFVDFETDMLMEITTDGKIIGSLIDLPIFGNGAESAISPDGNKVVVQTRDNSHIWIYDLVEGDTYELPGVEDSAGLVYLTSPVAWSEDSRYFAHRSGPQGELLIVDTTMRSVINRLEIYDYISIEWSPDAESLMLDFSYRENAWTLLLNREGPVTYDFELPRGQDENIRSGTWSPKGRWLLQTQERQKPPVLTELIAIN